MMETETKKEYTKTDIRKLIHGLVTDRLLNMNHENKMTKDLGLLTICTTLRNELEFRKRQGHNAHTALVRIHAPGIRKLAETLHTKVGLRENLLSMVETLTHCHDTTI